MDSSQTQTTFLHQVWWKSVRLFLCILAYKQTKQPTNKQTNKQTDRGENITLAEEKTRSCFPVTWSVCAIKALDMSSKQKIKEQSRKICELCDLNSCSTCVTQVRSLKVVEPSEELTMTNLCLSFCSLKNSSTVSSSTFFFRVMKWQEGEWDLCSFLETKQGWGCKPLGGNQYLHSWNMSHECTSYQTDMRMPALET